jgi:hypothetical protein
MVKSSEIIGWDGMVLRSEESGGAMHVRFAETRWMCTLARGLVFGKAE